MPAVTVQGCYKKWSITFSAGLISPVRTHTPNLWLSEADRLMARSAQTSSPWSSQLHTSTNPEQTAAAAAVAVVSALLARRARGVADAQQLLNYLTAACHSDSRALNKIRGCVREFLIWWAERSTTTIPATAYDVLRRPATGEVLYGDAALQSLTQQARALRLL